MSAVGAVVTLVHAAVHQEGHWAEREAETEQSRTPQVRRVARLAVHHRSHRHPAARTGHLRRVVVRLSTHLTQMYFPIGAIIGGGGGGGIC